MHKYRPHVPTSIDELIDKLGWMMLYAPTFEDDSGYFPGRNIETTFSSLNEGLQNVRGQVGEARYAALMELSTRMRAHFGADPEDKTDDAVAGRRLIHEMEDILLNRKR